MKITILGSEGYIGSALTPLLVKQFGAENIQRIDACLYGQHVAPKDVLKVSIKENKKQITEYIEAFQPGLIVNLAALAHDPSRRLPAAQVMAVNAYLPPSIAADLLARGGRLIAISSMSVHAEGSDAYPISKRYMERWLSGMGTWRGIDILRFGTLFGVMPGLEPTRVRPHLLLNSMVLDGIQKEKIQVNGTNRRPVTSLRAAVEAIYAACLPSHAVGQVRNVIGASADLYAWAYWVGQALKNWGVHTLVKSTGSSNPDTRSYAVPPLLGSDEDGERILASELGKLISYTQVHHRTLARVRKQAFVNLYRNLGVK